MDEDELDALIQRVTQAFGYHESDARRNIENVATPVKLNKKGFIGFVFQQWQR
jgi:hypothetical protein